MRYGFMATAERCFSTTARPGCPRVSPPAGGRRRCGALAAPTPGPFLITLRFTTTTARAGARPGRDAEELAPPPGSLRNRQTATDQRRLGRQVGQPQPAWGTTP